MRNYIATGNKTALGKADLEELERRLGGPVNAARTAQMSYVQWYRIREGQRRITAQTAKLLELLLRTSHMPFQYKAKPADGAGDSGGLRG